MLSSESLTIGEMFRAAVRDRYGDAALDARFRAFDTICSATQDRQDAVNALLAEQTLDLMIVLGGYNSSNTCNLAKICASRVPTYHIAAPDGLVSATEIRHKPVGKTEEVSSAGWLPAGAALCRADVRRLDAGQPGGGGDSPPGGTERGLTRRLLRFGVGLDGDADALSDLGFEVSVQFAARFHHNHGLVIDREIPFLRFLIRGAQPAADRESFLGSDGQPRQQIPRARSRAPRIVSYNPSFGGRSADVARPQGLCHKWRPDEKSSMPGTGHGIRMSLQREQ